jgi:2-polyprenyl-6-methoxyphenol hydroxylase-like FAD-dependent oxidoreductase
LRIWPEANSIVASLPGFHAFATGAYADVRVDPWVRGRVALVGDIAHGTSPQLGQGATLALLDAKALAAALSGEAKVGEALHAYARARRDHARYYQWSSWMLTPFFQSDDRWLGVVRDAFMGPVGRLPILRREFLATLTGHKTGMVFGRLDQRNLNATDP